MADLPEEMLMDILLRLPVESLVQFKCVCKSWYSLFESSEFVSRHMVKQSKDYIIFKRQCPKKQCNILSFFPNNDNDNDDGDGDNDFDVSFRITDLDLDLHISKALWMHGNCDGIIVLSDLDENIILCNPAIREVRILPKSSFHPFPQNYATYLNPEIKNPLHAETNGVGFGYDPKTNDYKIIRIVAFWKEKSSPFRLPSKAEVFSLRSSTWKEINNAVIEAQIWNENDMEQYFDGAYYWRASNDFTNEYVLLSFDFGDEIFRKTIMPDVCKDWLAYENIPHLGVFNNESIALYVIPISGFEKCIDVWVIQEFGNEDSWTKQLTIGPLAGVDQPLTLWKNDKELLQVDGNGQLVSYDLVSLKIKIVPMVAMNGNWAAADTYMKTLVSVNWREEDDIAA